MLPNVSRRTLKFHLDLYPAQDDFVYAPSKFAAFVAGIGSGKTYAGAIRALVKALAMPGLGMVIAPTYPMLRDSTLRTFEKVAGEAVKDFNRSEMRATMATGSEIIFRSADDPDRLRGPNISWAWIDEAALVSEDAWLIILGRLREGEGCAWVTTTPRGKQHWTYKTFGNPTGEYALYHATTRDNVWLPQGFLTSVEQAYAGSFAEQELGGEFVEPEGTLFKREWFQYCDKAPDGLRWIRAWDLALTTKTSSDRTASVKCANDALANLYIDAGIAGKWEYPEVREQIVETARRERGVSIVVERTAFQLAAVQELYRIPELMGVAIIPDDPNTGGVHETDKVSRARPWQARAANGKVILVRGAWVNDFLDEVCSFTATGEHKHDDYVDAVSAAVKHLGTPTTAQRLRQPPKPSPYAFLDK